MKTHSSETGLSTKPPTHPQEDPRKILLKAMPTGGMSAPGGGEHAEPRGRGGGARQGGDVRAAPGATCCSERHSPSYMPSSRTRTVEDRCAQEQRPRRTEEEQKSPSVREAARFPGVA
ncbi:hypothetical protein CHARACLAT_025519 [Characodon lateralis]|uniref:Uncharacterized protein n=2 Tax=Goodeidae TaxID=28758 RepID=A0ABU7F623_9TELE|nr:hypothetical protein [Characodon lateralis]